MPKSYQSQLNFKSYLLFVMGWNIVKDKLNVYHKSSKET